MNPTAAPLPNSRAWSVAWLSHLVAPALLLADIGIAVMRREIVIRGNPFITAFLVLLAGWLLVGAGLYFVIRNRPALMKRSWGPLLCLYAGYMAAGLAEITLHLIGVASADAGHRRESITVIRQKPELGPGMGGVKVFTINRLGLRGPMPPAERSVYRIVAIGASTTICSSLDDSEAWPNVLMTDLNSMSLSKPVWVGNDAADGLNTVNYIVKMGELAASMPFDMAIFLPGGNDLQATLAFEGGPTEAKIEKEAGFDGRLPPSARWRTQRKVYPHYRRLLLFSVIQNLTARFISPVPPYEIFIRDNRRLRHASPVRPLPDLSIGLREYRSRLAALADQCQSDHKRCLFLTEPSMWRDDMSPYEESLVWLGYVGKFESHSGHVSSGDMAKAMILYNSALLDVCKQRNLECLDLVSRVPKNTTAFYDAVHFNPSGSKLVAQVLADYLSRQSPF